MEKNSPSENENILVKVDQNNLIYIDPNSVIDKDGFISPRGVKQENLVIYVNLEADIIPRSILVAGNDQNTYTSIAKGTFNFLKNQSSPDFDTNWTNAFLDSKKKIFEDEESGQLISGEIQFDQTGQSFGMTSIEIDTKGFNAIPEVTITFVDVRGKTLFESPENSPYKAFFHVPWPIFYLTIKGFYGKAIRYRLHLVKFTSRFEESSGNFEVTTKFIGSTFAYLNDIPLKGMLNAPYMFLVETTKDDKTDGTTTTKVVSRSSKGYATLRSVYAEYIEKGLLPVDFPVKTLRELLTTAQSLDKLWESQILAERLDGRIFVGLEDYEKTLKSLEKRINAWGNVVLSKNYTVVNVGPDEILFYALASNKKDDPTRILGKSEKIQNTLEAILEGGKKELNESKLFTDSILKDKTMDIDFTRKTLLSKSLGDINRYVRKINNQFEVAFDLLRSDFNEIKNLYQSQKDKLEEAVEQKMNEIIKDNTKGGFGFEPTLRNIFGVILANADTYIRLLKDVHLRSFEVSNNRKKVITGLSEETKDDDSIYPWPEIKKYDGEKQKVLAYPGERDLISKLKSDDPILWPEVDFIEDYIGISTNRVDTNTDKESGVGNINYVFESDNIDKTKMLRISSLLSVTNATAYLNPSPASFLYEIWERANQITLVDSFDNNILYKLSEEEFNNIKEAVKDDDQLIYLLSTSATTANNLINLLAKFSPFERYPYYIDSIPTISYVKKIYSQPYKIEKYNKSKDPVTPTGFEVVNQSLLDYTPESYRTKIYPFNSNTYLDYLNLDDFSIYELKLRDTFKVDTSEGFIVSPISSTSWVKSEYIENIFAQKISVYNTVVNILNTPYFHKQLYEDLTTAGTKAKYVGSAYLVLNSLPFYDLQDTIIFSGTSLGDSGAGVRMSSLFREIGATHYVPYHLILKWGSIYHRYKKFILEDVDILSGFLDTSNVTQPIPGNTFFCNDQTSPIFTAYTASGETITFNEQTDIGVHPYYDALFHQVINGYNHYLITQGNISYSGNVMDNTIKVRSRLTQNRLKYWTQFVDNSKFDSTDLRYTLLPCDGGNATINTTITLSPTDTFDTAQQAYFRSIWVDDDYIYNEFSGLTFSSHAEYNLNYVTGSTTDKIYSVDSNYRKIIDLIATFSPNILDEFEQMFLDFATEKINDTSIYNEYGDIKYNNFQDLLKEILTVPKETNDNSDLELLIGELKNKQLTKLKNVTNEILSQNSLIKITIGNPKELDSYVLNGLLNTQVGSTFNYGGYEVSQLTTSNLNYIKLYLGEDIDGYYQSFFSSLNVELSEDNILQFRPIILIYGGYRKEGNPNNIDSFKTYLLNNIIVKDQTNQESAGSATRLSNYLEFLTNRFTKLKPQEVKRGQSKFKGYNDDPLKLELYNNFKSFNDKWIAGNSIGQKLLLEEFLFLDKANKDIGNDVYFNIDRLLDLSNPKNDKQNLYGVISILLQGTGLDMRALPAYINFYGTNFNNRSKIVPSSKVAQNLFGTFLDVDYQESSPKVIIQLVGPTSKHLADTSSKNKFKDDSYFVGSTHNNPVIITNPAVFNDVNLYKSNRVVAFEVSFGDQNQSLFKGVTLDQTSLKNTTESFVVLENLARSESGAGAYNVDIGLFDYYRQASYTCEVTMMGNMMIQPTMYFYLKNIPMFRGSYWITEVRHSIKNNNITTTFKGTRIPYASLPDPKDYFLATYRVLFDKLMNKTLSRIKNEQQRITTTINIKDEEGNNYTTDIGLQLDNENIDNIIVKQVGISKFGIPYNGFLGEKYIQLIKYNNQEWLRTRVVRLGGTNYPLNDNDEFGLISLLGGSERLKWSEIKSTAKLKNFYTTKFKIIPRDAIIPENIITYQTKFIVPKNNSSISVLDFTQTGSYPNRVFTGQIGTGPNLEGYGMGMSESLMKTLNVQDGDIIYFQLVKP